MIVGSNGIWHFRFRIKSLLLAPALFNRFQTPLGASTRGADRFAIHQDEYRVGVRGSIDSKRHPATAFEIDVEVEIVHPAVRFDDLFSHGIAIDDHLDWNAPRFGDSSAFDVPERALTIPALGGDSTVANPNGIWLGTSLPPARFDRDKTRMKHRVYRDPGCKAE